MIPKMTLKIWGGPRLADACLLDILDLVSRL